MSKVEIKEQKKQANISINGKRIQEENQKFLEFLEQQANLKNKEVNMNQDKLAELRAKLAKAKDAQADPFVADDAEVTTPVVEEEVPTVTDKRKVSITMGVIGVGQAGSRLAEEFYKLGYDVGVINTSSQDLEFIKVPTTNKLLLTGSLGGAGKDTLFARQIFENNLELISQFVDKTVSGNNMNILCISGGGGSGSGSAEVMVPILASTGSPLGVIYVLPKATEDAQSKQNAVETLAKLAKLTSQEVISTLIVVDNARIEQIYGGLSQSQFWATANSAIVEPIHIFNTLTAQPSEYTSLDPSDFGSIISTGNCSVYGLVEVENYMEETAIAEAMITSLNSNMLAEGFDLTQTIAGGVIIVASEDVLKKMPAANTDYAFSMISEQTNGAKIFQGMYAQDIGVDAVRIYSWFAGLGLPQDRIENLKKESKQQAAILAEKQKAKAGSMVLDLGENKVSSVKEEIQRKIQAKNSGFNKLQSTGKDSIINRRRK